MSEGATGLAVGVVLGVLLVVVAYEIAKPTIAEKVGRVAHDVIVTEAARAAPGLDVWAELPARLIEVALREGLRQGLP